jgi:hypothetical protein
MIAEESVMLKICKKIYKNAFGDIRHMLAIVKDILEKKLLKLRHEAKRISTVQGGSTDQALIQLSDLKVTVMEGFSVIEEKYSDVQGSIISTLSLPIQTCILAVYLCLQGSMNYIPYVISCNSRKPSPPNSMNALITWTSPDLT